MIGGGRTGFSSGIGIGIGDDDEIFIRSVSIPRSDDSESYVFI